MQGPCPIHPRHSNAVSPVEDAPSLAEADSQVDVLGVGEVVSAEDRISVLTLPSDPNVGEPGSVPQPHLISEQVDLPVTVAPSRTIVDLLKADDVRIVVANRLGHSVRPVPTVYATDALVDVVREYPCEHDRREVYLAGPCPLATALRDCGAGKRFFSWVFL